MQTYMILKKRGEKSNSLEVKRKKKESNFNGFTKEQLTNPFGLNVQTKGEKPKAKINKF